MFHHYPSLPSYSNVRFADLLFGIGYRLFKNGQICFYEDQNTSEQRFGILFAVICSNYSM